jgi:hypothetical protein
MATATKKKSKTTTPAHQSPLEKFLSESETGATEGRERTEDDVAKYKATVFDAAAGNLPADGELAEILRAAWKIRPEFDRDLEIYRRRLDAAEQLRTRVPEFERQYAEATAADRNLLTTAGSRPLNEFKTVAELTAAIELYQNAGRPEFTTDERARASRARNDAVATRQQCLGILARTADPRIDVEIRGLQGRIRHIVEVESPLRKELLNLPQTIADAQSKLDLLIRGVRPSGVNGANGSDRRLSLRAEYIEVRREYERLRGLEPRRKAAMKAQATAEAEVRRLESEIAQLHRSKLDPKNMDFSGVVDTQAG